MWIYVRKKGCDAEHETTDSRDFQLAISRRNLKTHSQFSVNFLISGCSDSGQPTVHAFPACIIALSYLRRMYYMYFRHLSIVPQNLASMLQSFEQISTKYKYPYAVTWNQNIDVRGFSALLKGVYYFWTIAYSILIQMLHV